MASNALTTDRRSFLVAAPLAAAAVTIPTMSFASARPWDVAMKRLLDADAACKAYDARVFTPYYDRELAFEKARGIVLGIPGYFDKRADLLVQHPNYRTPEPIHDEYERLSEAYCAEMGALMALPAPDLPALKWKLDHIIEPGSSGSTPSWSRDYVLQTTSDYQRLLGDA